MTGKEWQSKYGDGECMDGRECSSCSSTEDILVLRSLLNCAISWPVAFSLIWGNEIATNMEFPSKLREIVQDIVQEEENREESLDSQEKQLHSIIIDLLWVLYEKQVDITVEASTR